MNKVNVSTHWTFTKRRICFFDERSEHGFQGRDFSHGLNWGGNLVIDLSYRYNSETVEED